MAPLPILDPDWRPSSDDEALEALELLTAATGHLKEWLGERSEWETFLAEHPELTKAAPIDFTDAELLGALLRAEELRLIDKWRSKAKWPGAYTEEVGEALTGNRNVGTGDCIRIGRALGRLARAGKVRRTRTYGAPLWVAAVGGGDA